MMQVNFDELTYYLREYYDKEYKYSLRGVSFHEKPYFSDFILGFGYLIHIDLALKLDDSFFINDKGKSLYDLVQIDDKFYNDEFSEEELEYEIQNLEESILENIFIYLDGFNNKIKDVFKFLDFKKSINFLNRTNSLFDVINEIFQRNENLLKEKISLSELNDSFENFIKGYFDSEIYFKDYFSEFGVVPYHNKNKDNRFLINLLFNNFSFEKRESISIYDPCCRDGSLLINCMNFIKKINPQCNVRIVGCESNIRFFAICLARMMFKKQNPHNFIFDDINPESSYKQNLLYGMGPFDFIISDIGNLEMLRSQIFEDYNAADKIFMDLSLKYNYKLVLATSLNNMDNSKSFFTVNLLNDELDTIITLPMSSLHKRNSILILNKIKDEKRKNKFFLIDEYSNDIDVLEMSNNKYNRILKNYRDFEDFEYGSVFLNSDLGNDEFNFNNFILSKRNDYSEIKEFKFKEIFELNYLGKVKEDLLVKKSIDEKIVFYPNDIDSNIHEEYLKYNINEKFKNKYLTEYLYYYLNSNKCKENLKFLMRFNNKVHGNIELLKIQMPDKDAQKKVIEASRNLNEFFNKIEIWKNDFSNDILNYEGALEAYKEFSCDLKYENSNEFVRFCSNWRIVYQGLAWPLAYNYLKATKGSNDVGIKKKNYLRFFEFLTSFNVIILISGIKNSDISNEEYVKFKKDLWKLYKGDRTTWRKLNFGGWTKLYERLVEIYENNDFLIHFNRKFFDGLAKIEYYNQFDELRERRNDDSHGGLLDNIDEKTDLEKLQRYMDNMILDILNIYSGLKLYYITGSKDPYNSKKDLHHVLVLNGPCNKLFMNKIEGSVNLKRKRLYFYNPLNEKFLEIDDDLIKFDEKTNQLYIFNKVIDDKIVAYKCYQEKVKDFKVNLDEDETSFVKVSNEFKKDILRL